MKILLLEDDCFICQEVKNYFELDNHKVDYYNNGQELLDNANLSVYDMFLLDINTPIKNGIETLKEIRKVSNSPAIYLTAMNDIEHLKKGYEAGCNDYIRKPFIFEELELRINQLVHKNLNNKVRLSKNYFFDLSLLKLFFKEKEIDLKIQEKELLYLLTKNLGRAISTDTIINYIWEDKVISDNTLRTTIKKLRNKIEENFIINLRGIGYKIEKFD